MIPLDVEYYEPSRPEKHKIKSLTFLRRDFSKSDLNTCYMAVFSAFIADLICLYIPLIQYTDLSIFDGFLLFVEKQKGRISVFYCCNLVYLLVLYTGILTSFFWKNSMVWDILGNWALVGVFLTVLWLPFNRKYFILNIATSLINLICLKIRSDSKFSNAQVDQTN
ncbi:putative integral membrane protein [Theileria parva strain Muguga]|uniref:putative integral membrane protein n=1 Tax=Theileria parva strain Muguga TaxID=333668 RepID=UPI001C622C51|nr:putative integral membrane protein [Theileria parva strain Muguga]KAF5153598.1 putative integral membrane protein [Theileria parva strain Muguga]